ncbi:MAG: hypothetical protein MOB07_03190 [Acidobacteria bacterium]|nr:hypothetical protein [Acidobacteriota bacterium]MCI0591587.1 hypothetical protein [Gammaproteobacteria bacterium]
MTFEKPASLQQIKPLIIATIALVSLAWILFPGIGAKEVVGTLPELNYQDKVIYPSWHVMIVHNTAPLFYLTGATLLGMGILYGRLARHLFWVLGTLTTLLSGWAFFVFPAHPGPPPALVVFVLGWALAIILPQRTRLWGVALLSATGAVLIEMTYQAWAFVEMWPLLSWYGIAGVAALTSAAAVALNLILQRARTFTD